MWLSIIFFTICIWGIIGALYAIIKGIDPYSIKDYPFYKVFLGGFCWWWADIFLRRK